MTNLPKTLDVKIFIHICPYTNELQACSTDMTALGWPLIGVHDVIVSVPDVDAIDIAIAEQEAKIAEMSERENKQDEEIKQAYATLNRLRVQRETGGDENA